MFNWRHVTDLQEQTSLRVHYCWHPWSEADNGLFQSRLKCLLVLRASSHIMALLKKRNKCRHPTKNINEIRLSVYPSGGSSPIRENAVLHKNTKIEFAGVNAVKWKLTEEFRRYLCRFLELEITGRKRRFAHSIN